MNDDKKKYVTSPSKLVRNIAKKYGPDKLKRLFDLFASNQSCADIAQEFGLTRQRIFTWKTILGDEEVKYVLKTETIKALSDHLG